MNYNELINQLNKEVRAEINMDTLDKLLKNKSNLDEVKEEIQETLDNVVEPVLKKLSQKELTKLAEWFVDDRQKYKNAVKSLSKEEGLAYAWATLDLAVCEYCIKYEENVTNKHRTTFEEFNEKKM